MKKIRLQYKILTSELQSLTCPVSAACMTSTGMVSVPISISKDKRIVGQDNKQISPTGGFAVSITSISSLIASVASSVGQIVFIKNITDTASCFVSQLGKGLFPRLPDISVWCGPLIVGFFNKEYLSSKNTNIQVNPIGGAIDNDMFHVIIFNYFTLDEFSNWAWMAKFETMRNIEKLKGSQPDFDENQLITIQ